MNTEQLLKQIGSTIKRIREERKISQQDLAAACNFEKSNMSRIESGKSNLTIATLNKIANALGVPVGDLLSDGTDRPERRNGKKSNGSRR